MNPSRFLLSYNGLLAPPPLVKPIFYDDSIFYFIIYFSLNLFIFHLNFCFISINYLFS